MAIVRCRWLLALALLAGCQAAQRVEVQDGGEARFACYVLGRAQDGGLPHLGCDKPCCVLARRSGHVETPACLGIHDTQTDRLVLIEATPAIEAQVAMLQDNSGVHRRGRAPVDAILLTHAHVGHYAGLIHLGREVASTSAMPLCVTPRMAEFLASNGPWSQLVDLGQVDLQEIIVGEPFEPIEGLSVTAIAVPHRDEFSDTVAFKIRGPRRTVLFVPDIDRWEGNGGLLATLMDGVDVAYVDGTFFDGSELPGRDMREVPHPMIIDSLERLITFPVDLRFIHLNHTNPALRDEAIQRRIRSSGGAIAAVGERTNL